MKSGRKRRLMERDFLPKNLFHQHSQKVLLSINLLCRYLTKEEQENLPRRCPDDGGMKKHVRIHVSIWMIHIDLFQERIKE